MAVIVTKHQPGRMAASVVGAFGSRTLAGLNRQRSGKGMGQGSGISQGIIGRGFDFLSQRFGTPAGALVVGPDGSIVQRAGGSARLGL